MTFDGLHQYAYDAWGRMTEVKRAWGKDPADEVGSTIATLKYDAVHRRIVKDVTNSGDWNCEYHYYYDVAWRLLETRNGDDDVLKQHVWGVRYIDELVQVAVNTNPGTDNTCDAAYYAIQNANFSLVGLTKSDGTLVERYEYTPYGQRTVFGKPGSDDDLTMSALHHSQQISDGTRQPYTLCDIGHQGLMHDREFGLIAARYRVHSSSLQRWLQRDRRGYVDGAALYQSWASSPVRRTGDTGQDQEGKV